MKVILCGYHWTGCKALMLLKEAGHDVFVFSHKAANSVPSLEELCQKLNVPYSLSNISQVDLPFKPDLICSIYYRYIIKKHIIEACNGRIFNLHPALLPKYRGCSSLAWAMINGEDKVGYTYHYIDEGCDTGKVIIQKELSIEPFDTQLTLYNRVMFSAMNDFSNVVNLVANGFEGQEQIGEPTLYKRGCPHNGEIDASWPNDKIERFIRTMHYPPYPKATFHGHEVSSFEEWKELKAKYIIKQPTD